MKRILTFLITLGIMVAGTASASLWNWYQDKGLELPPIEARAKIYLDVGQEKYTGECEQNLALESYLDKVFKQEYLGGTRPTSPVAGMTYTLSGAGITSSATSITLQSLTIPQTGYELLDADFSDTFYITLEPGNTKRQEIVSCTTVVQGAGTTATLSGCTRGLLPIYPYTTSSTLKFSHAGGTQVIFSDPPQLFEQYTSKNSTSTISALWEFSVAPQSSDECSATNEFCTKNYIDSSVNQGAATSTEDIAGIAEQATQLEMASSTPFDANNPHFISSEYATTTPYTHTNLGNHVVVTKNDGYIDQEMLNAAYNFAWTGNHTFSGNVTTTNATSTSFSSQTVSTSLLIVDSVVADALVAGTASNADSLHTHTSLQTMVSSTSQTLTITNSATLFSVVTTTIAAGTLGTDECVFAEAYISDFDSNSNTPTNQLTIGLVYGSTTITSLQTNANADFSYSNFQGRVKVNVCGDGTTSKQFGTMEVSLYNVGLSNETIVDKRSQSFGTATENSSVDQSFRITSQWNGASVNENVVWKNAYVYKIVK